MKRRNFLKAIGIGGAAVVVAPVAFGELLVVEPAAVITVPAALTTGNQVWGPLGKDMMDQAFRQIEDQIEHEMLFGSPRVDGRIELA